MKLFAVVEAVTCFMTSLSLCLFLFLSLATEDKFSANAQNNKNADMRGSCRSLHLHRQTERIREVSWNVALAETENEAL